MRSYPHSKLCYILFSKELANRLQGSNIEVFSLHPGVIATGLSRHMGIVHYIKCYVMSFCLKSTEQGAATSVYAATAPELAGKSGAYLIDCHIAEPSAEAQDALWQRGFGQLQKTSCRILLQECSELYEPTFKQRRHVCNQPMRLCHVLSHCLHVV